MKLSNTKTKTILESVTLELTPQEFDIILAAIGSCPTGQVMSKVGHADNTQVMQVYYALKEIAADIKAHR